MNYNALKNLITRRLLMVAWTTTLVVGFMVSLPQLAHAQNPVEGDTVRVTWQDSRDTSSVWAKLINAVTV